MSRKTRSTSYIYLYSRRMNEINLRLRHTYKIFNLKSVLNFSILMFQIIIFNNRNQSPFSEVKVSLTRKPFRGTRKAFVRLKEARALTLLKATHMKIGSISCRVRKRTEISRCYRCLGFGHMAADCRGPDRSRSCWRCYLCTARDEKPRDDHISGTMRCAAFREAAPNRNPWKDREERVQAGNNVERRCSADCARRQWPWSKANAVPGSLSGEEARDFWF